MENSDSTLASFGGPGQRVDHAIAAHGKHARRRASVAVIVVAIIALLARIEETVSTEGGRAIISTTVGVVRISVVAFFAVVDCAVTTDRRNFQRQRADRPGQR